MDEEAKRISELVDSLLNWFEEHLPELAKINQRVNPEHGDFGHVGFGSLVEKAAEYGLTNEDLNIIAGIFGRHQMMLQIPAVKKMTRVYVYKDPVSLEPPYAPIDPDPSTATMHWNMHCWLKYREVIAKLAAGEREYTSQEIKEMLRATQNLIDQIVHPLIDSLFGNKTGEEFVQSRTKLQKDILAKARKEFEKYHVEIKDLLIAYIDADKESAGK